MSKLPNQREITINKELCNQKNLYTIINLEALNEALYRLNSKYGIKLYLYFAKNQNKYKFDLFSSDFCKSCCCSLSGYNTAFAELVEKGYLMQKEGTKTIYNFYEKSQLQEQPIIIENDKKTVEQYRQMQNSINKQFSF